MSMITIMRRLIYYKGGFVRLALFSPCAPVTLKGENLNPANNITVQSWAWS